MHFSHFTVVSQMRKSEEKMSLEVRFKHFHVHPPTFGASEGGEYDIM